MKRCITNQAGMTLVELLASIILLSIILLSFFTFFIQSAKNTEFNKEKLSAIDIAEQVVADMRNIKVPSALEEKGFQRVVEDREYNQTYSNYEVKVTFDNELVASTLYKAEITVTPTTEVDKERTSFTTGMYIGEPHSEGGTKR